MTKGIYKSGHFIVLRGVQDEKILVANPPVTGRSPKVWDLSIILNEASRRAGAGGRFGYRLETAHKYERDTSLSVVPL